MRILIPTLSFVGLATGAAAQGLCGPGPVTVEGRVIDADGIGVPEAMIHVSDLPCMAVSGTGGVFVMDGFPSDSLLFQGARPGYCIYPRWVRPGRDEPSVALQAVRVRDPLDDTQILVHGSPYVPPGYEEAHCFAESQRWEAAEPIPAHWQVASPRDALDHTLRHEAVRELLLAAQRDFEVVPITFRYGEIDGAAPDIDIRYRLNGPREEGEVYVLVRRADLTTLRVQVGRQVPLISGLTRLSSDEDGVLIEWRRSRHGWDSGTVLERWNRVPPG